MSRISAIAYALPDAELPNSVLSEDNPAWDMELVTRRTGVRSRRVSAPGETAYDLSVRACEALAAEQAVDFDAIDALVYCTQSPDFLMPGNAHLLHRQLGLASDVLAFDYALACSGFVYGIAMVDAFIRAGLASQALLVTAETMSKRINRRDRSSTVLFGDGAAVTHLVAGEGVGRGAVLAARLGSNSAELERVYVPAGGARMPRSAETTREWTDASGNVRSPEDMQMDGFGIWALVNSLIPGHLEAFLDEQSLGVDDIDLWVFHQASEMTFDSLAKRLGIERSKLYSNIAEIGNLSSASIPVALRGALDDGAICAGDRVLLCGFGAGFSYGSVLLQY